MITDMVTGALLGLWLGLVVGLVIGYLVATPEVRAVRHSARRIVEEAEDFASELRRKSQAEAVALVTATKAAIESRARVTEADGVTLLRGERFSMAGRRVREDA